MDSNTAFEVSVKALHRLSEQEGREVTFPFDKIWQYADENVASTLRPGQQRRLVKGGYIERTERMINAASEARAGSLIPEYRLGWRFRPDETLSNKSSLSATDEMLSNKSSLSVARSLRDIEEAMAFDGFIVTAEQLANFYLALKTSPLVILAGTSGTGKSRLPRLFSKLVGATFTLISVQPQWSDNTDLLGYTPSLDLENFVEGDFTKAVVRASTQTDVPAMVLLDEMNLAAVEHYFSNFLSIVETRRREQDGTITTDPLPLDLPVPKDPDRYDYLRNLRFLPNIRVIGTANMDETTRVFSPKVLDRAFSIEFDEVDLTAFVEPRESNQVTKSNFSWVGKRLIDTNNPVSVSEVYSSSRDLFDQVAGLTEEIKVILKPAGISLGYRTRDAICLYMWHWEHDGLADILSIKDALDLCILQKILPKVSGTGEGLRKALEDLHEWLLRAGTAKEVATALPNKGISREEMETFSEEDYDESTAEIEILNSPFQRSAEKIARMLQKLSDEGAVTYWGA